MSTETLMTYPCTFTLKVFGHATVEFEQAVVTIVREHVPSLDHSAIVSTPSKAGQYTALRITFEAHSREQLDALYHAISAHPLVKLAL